MLCFREESFDRHQAALPRGSPEGMVSGALGRFESRSNLRQRLDRASLSKKPPRLFQGAHGVVDVADGSGTHLSNLSSHAPYPADPNNSGANLHAASTSKRLNPEWIFARSPSLRTIDGRPRFAVDLPLPPSPPLLRCRLHIITKPRSGATPHAGGLASDISLGRAAGILRISREDATITRRGVAALERHDALGRLDQDMAVPA